jgi:hypothetical protein
MVVNAPLRWLGIMLLALASLGCGVFDKLTNSDGDRLTIQKFSASPVTIVPGSSTTLAWEVDGADVVTIDNGIGAVPPKGSRQVLPGATTTYSMTAQAGASAVTASAQVVVQGSQAPTPTPSTTPTPAATPTPTPSATPSATPTSTPTPGGGQVPTPTPSATAAPTATPAPPPCGAPAGNAGTCTVTITKPNPVSGGGCVEVNLVTTDSSCPVGMSIPVLLRFDVNAHSSAPSLTWRRAPANHDLLDPGDGFLDGNGSTTVVLTDVVLDDAAEIEVLEGATVVLSLSVHH